MWDDGTVWEGAASGQLLLRWCEDCSAVCHPPLPMCPRCQSLRWDIRPASGRAQLKAWFVATHPHQSEQQQRIVIVAALAEGVNFVSNLVDGALADLYVDMPLDLCFHRHDGALLPAFRPRARGGEAI